jgi:hypothetical protein
LDFASVVALVLAIGVRFVSMSSVGIGSE